MAPPRGLFLSLPTPEKDSRSGFRNATQAMQDAADTLPMGAAPAGVRPTKRQGEQIA